MSMCETKTHCAGHSPAGSVFLFFLETRGALYEDFCCKGSEKDCETGCLKKVVDSDGFGGVLRGAG